MTRLIFLMPCPGVIHVRQPVKRQLAIALESFGRRPAVDFLVRLVPGVRAHGIDQPAPPGDLLERGVKESAEHSMLKGFMKIPDLPPFFLYITFAGPYFS